MSLDDLLKQQRKALKKRKYKKALRLLNSIEEEIDKTDAWAWLQKHELRSYKQLIKKLEYAAEGLAPSGRSELKSLASVFQWCKEHNIKLSLFDLPGHVANYREAASWLRKLIRTASGEDEAGKAIRDAVNTINKHTTRRQTREMVRTPRKKESAGSDE